MNGCQCHALFCIVIPSSYILFCIFTQTLLLLLVNLHYAYFLVFDNIYLRAVGRKVL